MAVIPFANAAGGADPYSLTSWAFSNAWGVATEKSNNSDSLFTQSLTAGGGAPTITPATLTFAPAVVEPNVNIPQQAEGASIEKFTELSDTIIAKLSDLFTDYVATYFPNGGYFDAAKLWIEKAITTGGTGINPNVENAIWQRDRSRILDDAAQAEDEAVAAWAARGYPMPPGAAAYQVARMRKDVQAKLVEVSHDIAVKQFETEVENMKFAVSQAVDLYAKALAAAGDYIKALAVGPNASMQVIPSVTDSQSRLISAASEYYRARISVEELRLKGLQTTPEYEQRTKEKNADLIMGEIKTRVQAAVAAAQSMGTQAASALNSLHASASVSGGSSNSVGYSYSGEVTSNVAPKTSA